MPWPSFGCFLLHELPAHGRCLVLSSQQCKHAVQNSCLLPSICHTTGSFTRHALPCDLTLVQLFAVPRLYQVSLDHGVRVLLLAGPGTVSFLCFKVGWVVLTNQCFLQLTRCNKCMSIVLWRSIYEYCSVVKGLGDTKGHTDTQQPQ
jgi:hypothetical protein